MSSRHHVYIHTRKVPQQYTSHKNISHSDICYHLLLSIREYTVPIVIDMHYSTAMESNEIEYKDSVLSLGIGVTICWLVVTLGTEILEKKNLILTQEEGQRKNQQHERRGLFIALTTILIVYIGSAIGIAMTTQDMDWRMFAVITGLSRCEFFENSSC